jgi:DNA polymerase IV
MCPELRLVSGRHQLYVEYHHRIIAAIEKCIPVTRKDSIDEVACRLMGRERKTETALQLAAMIKSSIREEVGDYLRCSIGIAPNRFLAKVASDMQKPDGLTTIEMTQLPDCLFKLEPQDLPGIGWRMNARLQQKGIYTMQQLCSLTAAEMRSIWGGVVGERFWHWLRGADFDLPEYMQGSVGHQHVLPPELRTVEQAGAVAQKLLHRAAARLRKMKMWTGGLSVYVSFSGGREKGIWECHTRIIETQDTLALLETFRKLWQSCPKGKPTFVGIALYDLVPDFLHSLSIFEEDKKRLKISEAIDSINKKFGTNTVYAGGIHNVLDAAPVCVAFSSIPDFEVPQRKPVKEQSRTISRAAVRFTK